MKKFRVLLLIGGRKYEWVAVYASGKWKAEDEAKKDWRWYPWVKVIRAERVGEREFRKLRFWPASLDRRWKLAQLARITPLRKKRKRKSTTKKLKHGQIRN